MSERNVSGLEWVEGPLRQRSAAITASIDGMALLDQNGVYTYMNNAHAEIYGYNNPEELLGKTWEILYDEEQLRWFEEHTMPVLGREGYWRGEAIGKKRDDSTFPQEVSITTVEGGGFVCVVRDVTERKRAEEALAKERNLLRTLIDNLPDYIFVKDAESHFVINNIEHLRVLGATEQSEVLGKTDFEVFSRELAQQYYADEQEVVRSGRPLIGREEPLVDQAGNKRWLSTNKVPLRDSAGEIIGLVGMSRDITERKQAEEVRARLTHQAELRADVSAALAESSTLRSVLQGCTEAVVRHLNAAFARVWTLNEAQNVLELQASAGIYTHLDGAHSRVPMGALKIGRIAQERQPHLTNDVLNDPRISDREWAKQEGMVAFAGYPLVVEGRLVGVMAMFAREELADDTIEALASVADTIAQGIERRRAEAEIRRLSHYNRTLFEANLAALMTLDPKGTITDVNKATEEITGFSREKLIGTEIFSYFEDPKRARKWFREVLSEGAVRGYELDIRNSDGRTIPVAYNATVYRDEDGEVAGILASARDITDRKRAEEALKESEERYRRQARELGLLHEVRTALAQELELLAVFRTVVEAIARTYGYTLVSAYLLEGEELVLQHHVGYERVLERIPVTRGIMGRVVRAGRSVLLEDVREDPAFLEAIKGITSEVCVPLFDEGEVVGTLNVESTGGVRLTEDDLRLVSALGEHVSVAISRARLYTRVRQSEERFRSLVQNASDIITLYGADGSVRYVSPAIKRVLGYEPVERIGADSFELIHPGDVARAKSAFAEALRNPGVPVSVEMRVRHRDGSWRHMEAISTNLLDDPSVRAIVLNSRDVTERKALEERLEYQAFHDPLTDLPNRALFLDRLKHALNRAGRRAEKVAVLFMDLDNFKLINDSLGHEVGDKLLAAVAERLRACLRPGDTAARFGGDEFTVLLEGVTRASDATRVAERIVEGLQAPFTLEGEEVLVTTSIGIALSDSAQDRPVDLLREADLALYQVKGRGKAQHKVSEGVMNSQQATEHLKLTGDLRQAIERGELRVYYQPKVQLGTNLQQHLRFSGRPAIVAEPEDVKEPRIMGMEALVRWEHPERGLVPPKEFIPVAEETDLMIPIGQWVLEEACRQARAWQERHPSDPPLVMCVNLSATQFQYPELAQDIARVLQETGLDPCTLCLEITESVVMEGAPHTIITLQALKDLGVRLAVDDFGTGYSSLAYLKRFPVSFLKIDRSFVDGLRKDPEDAVIVSAIITLAHTLDMQVIAEGVETAAQLAHLQGLGCDLAQGYYFSKPLPGEAAGALLARGEFALP